jgi:hypothetical protein
VEIPWCRFTGKKKSRIALVKTADRAVELDLGVSGPEEIEIVTGDNEGQKVPVVVRPRPAELEDHARYAFADAIIFLT